MILGNCMTGIALGLNTLTTSLMLRRASVRIVRVSELFHPEVAKVQCEAGASLL